MSSGAVPPRVRLCLCQYPGYCCQRGKMFPSIGFQQLLVYNYSRMKSSLSTSVGFQSKPRLVGWSKAVHICHSQQVLGCRTSQYSSSVLELMLLGVLDWHDSYHQACVPGGCKQIFYVVRYLTFGVCRQWIALYKKQDGSMAWGHMN